MKLIPQDFWDDAEDLTGRVQAALDAARDGDRVHLPGVAEGVPALGVYSAPLGGWRIQKNISVGGDGRGSTGRYTGTTIVPGSAGEPWDVFVVEPPGIQLDYVCVHDVKITHRQGQAGADGASGVKCLPASASVLFLHLERIIVLNHSEIAFDCSAANLEGETLERLLMLNCGTNGGNVANLGARMINVRFATVMQSAVFSNANGGWLVERGRVTFYACGFENNGLASSATQGQLLLSGCSTALVESCHFELFDQGPVQQGLAASGLMGAPGGPVVACATYFENAKASAGYGATAIAVHATASGPVAVLPCRHTRVQYLVGAASVPAGTTVLPQFHDALPSDGVPVPPPGIIVLPPGPNEGMVASPSINRLGPGPDYAGLVLPAIPSDPSSGPGLQDGMLYFDTTDARFRVRIGGTWRTVKTV